MNKIYILEEAWERDEAGDIIGVFKDFKLARKYQKKTVDKYIKEFVKEHNYKQKKEEWSGDEEGNPFWSIQIGATIFALKEHKIITR